MLYKRGKTSPSTFELFTLWKRELKESKIQRVESRDLNSVYFVWSSFSMIFVVLFVFGKGQNESITKYFDIRKDDSLMN